MNNKLNLEDIKKLQHHSLKMLGDFDDFCQQHSLRYFVCGGACIGIARSGKLIPWDDDIDLFMPRPDYEKFKVLWEKYGDKEEYTLCRTNKHENYHTLVTVFKDNHTTFINEHSVDEDIHHGYMLDVLPLDGMAPTKRKRKIQKLNAMIYSVFNAQRLPDNQGKLIRTLTKIIYGIFRSNELKYRLWSSAERRMSKYDYDKADYIVELASGLKYMGNAYPKEIFEDDVTAMVENTPVRLPVGYDTYLTMAFGNYKELPKKEDQIPKHNVVFYDLDNSYKKYKGIYYLKEK